MEFINNPIHKINLEMNKKSMNNYRLERLLLSNQDFIKDIKVSITLYLGVISSNNNNTIAVKLTAKGKTVHVNRDEILATKKTL
jgi:hypothetical protein